MTPNAELIEQSIAALRQLADAFSRIPGEAQDDSAPARLLSKELLLSISVLLPKLERVRPLYAPSSLDVSMRRAPRCIACDD